MEQIVREAVIPDLQQRSGQPAVIRSRTLRTWGESESGLAERLADHVDELDAAGNATLAYLASGIEGLKLRITVKAADEAEAVAALDVQEKVLRDLLGSLVFGIDDIGMEHAVAELILEQGRTLAVAESLTGGLVAARLVNVSGASRWFRGGLVSYASDVKRSLLGVPEGPVVSEAAAAAMASGVRQLLGADIGLAVTGVAGPDEQDGERPGTVFFASAGVRGPDDVTVVRTTLPGDRQRVRQFACISLLDMLRRQLAPSDDPAPRL
jgi:nicotinamide-nucleotide amidase